MTEGCAPHKNVCVRDVQQAVSASSTFCWSVVRGHRSARSASRPAGRLSSCVPLRPLHKAPQVAAQVGQIGPHLILVAVCLHEQTLCMSRTDAVTYNTLLLTATSRKSVKVCFSVLQQSSALVAGPMQHVKAGQTGHWVVQGGKGLHLPGKHCSFFLIDFVLSTKESEQDLLLFR